MRCLAVILARIVEFDQDFSSSEAELIEQMRNSDKPEDIKQLIIDLYRDERDCIVV